MQKSFCRNVLLSIVSLIIINDNRIIVAGSAKEVNKKDLSDLLQKIKGNKVPDHDLKERNLGISTKLISEELSLKTRSKNNNTMYEQFSTRSFVDIKATSYFHQFQNTSSFNRKHLSSKGVTSSEIENLALYYAHLTSSKSDASSTTHVKDPEQYVSNTTKIIHRITPYAPKEVKSNNFRKNAKRPMRPKTKCPNHSYPPFQLWCIEAKVNDAITAGTDADVVLELSLSDGTTCLTDPLNSWKDDFEHGATEKFCGRGVLGLGGVLGECLDKIISCEFKVSIRLLPSIFVSVKPKDLQLDWVKVSNYKGNMFHINNQSTTFYNWEDNIPKRRQSSNSSSDNNKEGMTTKTKIES